MSKRKHDDETDSLTRVHSRFKSDTGELLFESLVELPITTTVDALQELCNAVLRQDNPVPLAFYVNNIEVTDTLEKHVDKSAKINEQIVEIVYQPQAAFKVRAVTRCTGSLDG